MNFEFGSHYFDITYTNEETLKDGYYGYDNLLLSFNNSSQRDSAVHILWADYSENESQYVSYSKYHVSNQVFTIVQTVASLCHYISDVFKIIGYVFLAFSMLLFYNFISISINNKRREIGILRAVGARGVDVFKIFYSESIIIASINQI